MEEHTLIRLLLCSRQEFNEFLCTLNLLTDSVSNRLLILSDNYHLSFTAAIPQSLCAIR